MGHFVCRDYNGAQVKKSGSGATAGGCEVCQTGLAPRYSSKMGVKKRGEGLLALLLVCRQLYVHLTSPYPIPSHHPALYRVKVKDTNKCTKIHRIPQHPLYNKHTLHPLHLVPPLPPQHPPNSPSITNSTIKKQHPNPPPNPHPPLRLPRPPPPQQRPRQTHLLLRRPRAVAAYLLRRHVSRCIGWTARIQTHSGRELVCGGRGAGSGFFGAVARIAFIWVGF